jgi:hypothetical protein
MITTPAPLPAQPADLGGMIDATFRTFALTLWACFPLTVAPGLISLLPALWMPDVEVDPAAALEWFLRPSTWLIYACIIMVSVLCMSAVVHRMGMAGRGHPVSLTESVGRGIERFAAALLGWLLYVLILLVSLVPLFAVVSLGAGMGESTGAAIAFLLGLWLLALPTWASLAFGLFLYALVLERRSAVDSLRRSAQLIHGHWWRSSVVIGVAILVYSMAIMFAAIIVGVIAAGLTWAAHGQQALQDPSWLIGFQLLLTPFAALGQQLFIASGLVVFNDLSLRMGTA